MNDKEILKLVKTSTGKFNNRRLTKEYLVSQGVYDYVINRYNDNSTDLLMEVFYRMENGLEEIPKCKSCGNPIKFNPSTRKYATFCSQKCSQNDPDIKKHNAEVVGEIKKQQYANNNDEIMRKRAATIKEHTGEDTNGSAFCIKEVQKKAHETISRNHTLRMLEKENDYRQG